MSRIDVHLLIDSRHGVYILSNFIKEFEGWTGISDEDREILAAGPEHEWYWEAWDDVLDSARCVDKEGKEWCLHQEDDLFAIRYCEDGEYDAEKWFGN